METIMQPATFAHLVEQIQQLSTDEKQELQQLLERYLIEDRRHAILCAYEEVRTVENTLEFSNDVELLKKRLSL